MRFRPPLRVSVTRHGDKEQKLRDFVASTLPTPTIGPRQADAPDRWLPARSTARSSRPSPVLAREIAGAGRVGAHDPGPGRPRDLRRRLVRRRPRGRLRSRGALGSAPAPDRGARAARAGAADLLDRRLHAPRSDQVRRLRELCRGLRRGCRLRAGLLRAAVDCQRAAAGAEGAVARRPSPRPVRPPRRWPSRDGGSETIAATRH